MINVNSLFYFQKFLELSDATKSGSITLAEFIHYVKEHEKSLRLSFSNIDKNKDGKFLPSSYLRNIV